MPIQAKKNGNIKDTQAWSTPKNYINLAALLRAVKKFALCDS